MLLFTSPNSVPNNITVVTKSWEFLIESHNENSLIIGLREVQFHTYPSILGFAKNKSKVIDFQKLAKLGRDGFKDAPLPKFDKKVM